MLSIQKYRDFLKLAPDQESDLVDLKDEVEELWVSETQRPWKAESARIEVHRLDGNRNTTIFLRLTPVITIAKVEVQSDSGTDTWEELLLADGGWKFYNDQLIRIGTWWKPLVQITYDAGYATDACPADVKRALKMQARFSRERLDGEMKISAQSFRGGVGTFVAPTMHEHFERLAEKYRDLV